MLRRAEEQRLRTQKEADDVFDVLGSVATGTPLYCGAAIGSGVGGGAGLITAVGVYKGGMKYAQEKAARFRALDAGAGGLPHPQSLAEHTGNPLRSAISGEAKEGPSAFPPRMIQRAHGFR